MRHKVLSSLIVALLFSFGLAAGVAYAPYHTTPTPPPSTPSSPSGLSAAQAQAKVAAAHGGFAAEGGTVSYVHEHIGHTLACIEGATGKNVNAAWENPCQGMGNGVLPDLERANASASLIEKAKTADAAAVSAMKNNGLAQTKASAKQVSTLMKEIAEAK
ncbi:MAG TPA: hypothetical protein VI007_11740 [bacterium]